MNETTLIIWAALWGGAVIGFAAGMFAQRGVEMRAREAQMRNRVGALIASAKL